MARVDLKLQPRFVDTIFRRGKYGDGRGLWLQVAAGGTKSWIFRFMLNGRAREMGLGSLEDVSLKEARDAARRCRQTLRAGLDPIEERARLKRESESKKAKQKTFRECGDAYINSRRKRWGNAKHAAQWQNTLETYAYPTLGKLNVNDIDDVDLILKCIEPIWWSTPTTANRVRSRIEKILTWARVKGYREKGKENPAKWDDNLEEILPPPSEVQPVEHRPAIDYRDIGLLMQKLRRIPTISALALDFVFLTSVRVGEAVSARWKEFDLDAGMWTIPAERMKGRKGNRKPHEVPLSPGALDILDALAVWLFDDVPDPEDFVFPGQRQGRPISGAALLKLLDDMGFGAITVHGGRATFRTWATDCTTYPKEVPEKCLAHTIPDKVEAAYRRGELYEKRSHLMGDWYRYCAASQSAAEAAGDAARRQIRVM